MLDKISRCDENQDSHTVHVLLFPMRKISWNVKHLTCKSAMQGKRSLCIRFIILLSDPIPTFITYLCNISDWEEIFANGPFSAFFNYFEIFNGPFLIILNRLRWAIFEDNGTMAHGPLPSQLLNMQFISNKYCLNQCKIKSTHVKCNSLDK